MSISGIWEVTGTKLGLTDGHDSMETDEASVVTYENTARS